MAYEKQCRVVHSTPCHAFAPPPPSPWPSDQLEYSVELVSLRASLPATCKRQLRLRIGAVHTPAQVQKLFFLIDRNIHNLLGGPCFDFMPYNYGPFDQTVYRVLEQLAVDDLVELVPDYNWTSYRLTAGGQKIGEGLLESLSSDAVLPHLRVGLVNRRYELGE